MRIKSGRIVSYKSWCVNEATISEVAEIRLNKIRLYDELKKERCSDKIVLNAIGVSKSTVFLWKKNYKKRGLKGLDPKSTKPKNTRKRKWSKKVMNLVLSIRKKHPYWGKEKIHCLLVREYNIHDVSQSTVGRMISYWMDLNKIHPVARIAGHSQGKKRRTFKKHANRLPTGMKAKQAGELVQIDHMTVRKDGDMVKDFRALCPVTKTMITEVYKTASSGNAALFLQKVLEDLDYPAISIQVDGGSEFMKTFEEACEALGIKLFVLPPRSPKINGCVERANRTARTEFYSQYQGSFSLEPMRQALAQYQHMYNSYRPHQALDNLTPFQYTDLILNIEVA